MPEATILTNTQHTRCSVFITKINIIFYSTKLNLAQFRFMYKQPVSYDEMTISKDKIAQAVSIASRS